EGMAKQEVDRYTFRAPGQATSYFFGYQSMLEIRQRAELALGGRLDRQRFNDFVLSQGMLPPDLLLRAVMEEFVPPETVREPASPRGQDELRGGPALGRRRGRTTVSGAFLR